MIDTRYLYLLIRFKQLSLFYQHPLFWAKADAKIQPFCKPTKYFFKKNYFRNRSGCKSARNQCKNFYLTPLVNVAKSTHKHAIRQKWVKKAKERQKTSYFLHITLIISIILYCNFPRKRNLAQSYQQPPREVAPTGRLPANAPISSVFLRLFFGSSSVDDRRTTEEQPKNNRRTTEEQIHP